MKFGWSKYWAPTPVNIRKVADAIVVATTAIGGSTIATGNPTVGTIIFIVGVVAKFISNFFADETE